MASTNMLVTNKSITRNTARTRVSISERTSGEDRCPIVENATSMRGVLKSQPNAGTPRIFLMSA